MKLTLHEVSSERRPEPSEQRRGTLVLDDLRGQPPTNQLAQRKRGRCANCSSSNAAGVRGSGCLRSELLTLPLQRFQGCTAYGRAGRSTDLLESTDEAAVVHFRLQLHAGLHDVHGGQRAVGQRAADTTGQSTCTTTGDVDLSRCVSGAAHTKRSQQHSSLKA
eukprot:scaffold650_cov249-Pinguiococcus_pyrenoidosus.AAC.7